MKLQSITFLTSLGKLYTYLSGYAKTFCIGKAGLELRDPLIYDAIKEQCQRKIIL